MLTNEINIRDPYVLVHNGSYYLYGTRSETCWGSAEGFDCYISQDMEHWTGPVEIFRRPEDFFATRNFWAPPIPFAEAEFGMKGDVYFTDGPCLFPMEDGKLYMTWSSWSNEGYAVGIAVSENGDVKGPWKQQEEPIWPQNGGHGMVFQNLAGERYFVLHYPNDKTKERPCFKRLVLENGMIKLL